MIGSAGFCSKCHTPVRSCVFPTLCGTCSITGQLNEIERNMSEKRTAESLGYPVSEKTVPPDQEKSLREIQLEIGAWSYREFGNNLSKDKFSVCFNSTLGSWPSFAGMVEELGEFARALSRPHQGRWKEEKNGPAKAAKEDALADLLVFMCDCATREGIDLQSVLNKVWDTVSKRRQATWVEDKEKENVPASTDNPCTSIPSPPILPRTKPQVDVTKTLSIGRTTEPLDSSIFPPERLSGGKPVRTKSEIVDLRNSPRGCCGSYADNMGCECWEKAIEDIEEINRLESALANCMCEEEGLADNCCRCNDNLRRLTYIRNMQKRYANHYTYPSVPPGDRSGS